MDLPTSYPLPTKKNTAPPKRNELHLFIEVSSFTISQTLAEQLFFFNSRVRLIEYIIIDHHNVFAALKQCNPPPLTTQVL